MKKQFFMECHVAGRKYHDADDVWDDLKVGTKLRLMRDKDNRYDPNAVVIVYEREEGGELILYTLGYVPQDENEALAVLLDMGWGHIFECTLSLVNPQANYEQQLHATIKVKKC